MNKWLLKGTATLILMLSVRPAFSEDIRLTEDIVQRYVATYPDFWKLTKGRYLRPETKNYVPKIMALAIIGKNLEVFGFNEIQFEKALDYEEIMVKGNADLYEVSEVLELDFEEIKRFNFTA